MNIRRGYQYTPSLLGVAAPRMYVFLSPYNISTYEVLFSWSSSPTLSVSMNLSFPLSRATNGLNPQGRRT